MAHYINSEGKASTDTFGPELKTDDAKSRRTRFDFLIPNTNYTATICAVTRRKECGEVGYINLKKGYCHLNMRGKTRLSVQSSK